MELLLINKGKIGNPKEKGQKIWTGKPQRGNISVEAEAPVLWPPDVESQLIGKDPDAGQDWGQKEKWVTEDEMVR